ncbi:MAG TPA: glycoside hydrolase family 3 N-terminal domain-containing protein [Gemmatimonadales bacterium]|nr:glycoside hydrolase family 3 N-terminal domain-containing protein [Gemmatimonadales bacterium]
MQATLLVLVTLLLAACGRATPEVTPPHPTRFPPAAVAVPDQDTDALIRGLSPRDKIAQLVMPWIPGTYAAYDDEAFARMAAWVEELHVGGLIVSVGSPLDIAAKLNRLQRRSTLPLLIGADLEGGTSIRFTGGTPLPPNMGVGATGSDSAAYHTGRITALEGRAVGIHLAFAPVADINNNPDNPIINTRSFGEDPATVARLVAAEVRGLQDHGMLATAKHFPGHGDTGTDSHLALPVITSDWRRLDSVELVPFRAAIGAGVELIMSAHIALPAIDPGELRPGTVAPNVLTGILRDSLGFGGMVVTDALNMAGVANKYGAGAAVRAFLAGADLLLQPADPAAAIDAMAAALERGEYTVERLDRSLRRVLEAKRALGLFRQRTVPLDSIPALVGSAAFQETARDIAARSIVMVKDVGGTVHGLRRAPRGIALVSYGEDDNRGIGGVLAGELRAQGFSVAAFRLWPGSGPASYDSAATLLARHPTALFAVADRPVAGRGTIGLPRPLLALLQVTGRGRPTILLSLGNPYLISRVPEVGSYLIGWRTNLATELAAARAIAGAASITGRLPISIPPAYPRGWGVTRHVR